MNNSKYLALAFNFGINLLTAIGILGFAGWWLDGRLGTRPWLMLLGIGLGIVTAFRMLFRELLGPVQSPPPSIASKLREAVQGRRDREKESGRNREDRS